MSDKRAVEKADFLEAMSRVASTVSVVTSNGAAGRAGVTVSTMASVSADGPEPVILVCIHHQASALERILKNGCFCANMLAEDQSEVAEVFAGRIQPIDNDRFSGHDWIPTSTGALRLSNPLSAFDCEILEAKQVGTHKVLFGGVKDVFIGRMDRALLFQNRDYRTTSELLPDTEENSAFRKNIA
ncbi:MAG: flavin reductase family protein [Pseudomonadota bacterium]